MDSRDEVKRLRQDLDAIRRQAEDISRRLTELEGRGAERIVPEESPGVSTPPPIPADAGFPDRVTAKPPSEQAGPLTRLETLHAAVRRGDAVLIKQCIEQGVDVNGAIESQSALDLAIERGSFEIVRLLVAAGAVIEHYGSSKKSQIRRARFKGFHDIADFLQVQLRSQSAVSSSKTVYKPAEPPLRQGPASFVDIGQALSDTLPVRLVRERINELRTRTRELGWEVLLGTYWLPRIAVVCIAIAVVFFLTLAIERWGVAWMPHLRIAIGYAVSAGLLLLAWRSEAKYAGLARVLYGGGFAVMYFVTFATHYAEFARIFDSPLVTLALLAGIVIAWGVVAQLRQSKVIAVLVTTLGHFTVMLSTLTIEQAAPASMAGLVFLSMGSAFFLLRNRWYYVAFLGLIGSYLNDLLTLAHGRSENPYAAFWVSMGVLTLFFFTFALAELFSSEELRRKSVPGWFRNIFVSLNTAAFLFLGTVLVSNFDFTRGHQDIFRFAVAAALFLIGMGYLRFRSGDPLFNVYFLKSAALLTLALATRYGGSSLSGCLAVEMVVLLVSARRSGLVISRLLAFAVGAIAFVQSFGTALHLGFGAGLWPVLAGKATLQSVSYAAPGYFQLLFQAALSALAFFISSQLYQRVNWRERSPKTLPFPQAAAPELFAFCWNLEFIAERPGGVEETEKPIGGILFPHLYALLGSTLLFTYAFPLVCEGHRFAVLTIMALLLTSCAMVLESKPFGLASVSVFVLSGLFAGTQEISSSGIIHLPVMIGGLLAGILIALASEGRWLAGYEGLSFHRRKVSPYFLYGVTAWLTGLLMEREFPGLNGVFAFGLAALLAAGLFLFLNPGVWILISGGFVLGGTLILLPEVFAVPVARPVFIFWAVAVSIVLSISLDRWFCFFKSRTTAGAYVCAGLILNAALVCLCYFERTIQKDWLMTATALACYAFLAYAFLFRSPAAAAVAGAGMLYASVRHGTEVFAASSLHAGIIIAFVALSVFWVVTERLCMRLISRDDWLPAIASKLTHYGLKRPEIALLPIGLAAALLLLMADRIPHLAPCNLVFITTGWFVLAGILFLCSLAFRQKFYRYAGLLVIVLSLMRLFLVDMREQDPLLRVFVFAVVGAGLLCVSVGYYRWMAGVQKSSRGETVEDRRNEE